MRIYSITPIHVGPDELARRQTRYDQLCPAGVSVDLHDVGPEAPTALNTPEEIRASEEILVQHLRRAADEDYAAVMPDCVLDPGVPLLSGTLAVPVIGILRLSAGWSVLTGRRFGAVARNRAIADELASQVARYGYADQFTGVEVLDLDVHAIADTQQWAESLSTAAAALSGSRAQDVINGCSAVDIGGGVDASARLVDPTALALRLFAAGELP